MYAYPFSCMLTVATHTFTYAPFSTLSTRLGVPEHDSPKKSTLGVDEKGDAKVAKLGEKRRPGTVTFGEVTYI
jgi:hypothetical protein